MRYAITINRDNPIIFDKIEKIEKSGLGLVEFKNKEGDVLLAVSPAYLTSYRLLGKVVNEQPDNEENK